jgi:phosphohistidine phosphatase
VYIRAVKTILLVRHAKAEMAVPGERDIDRPLSERGHDDAQRMGKAVRAIQLAPDALVTSEAKRAQETAADLAKAMRFTGTIRRERTLYDSSGEAWIAVLGQLPPSVEVAMVVGHSPGIEQAAALLVGANSRFLDCPAAAVVGFESGIGAWKDLAEGGAVLRFFLRPKLIEAIC